MYQINYSTKKYALNYGLQINININISKLIS